MKHVKGIIAVIGLGIAGALTYLYFRNAGQSSSSPSVPNNTYEFNLGPAPGTVANPTGSGFPSPVSSASANTTNTMPIPALPASVLYNRETRFKGVNLL